MLVPLIPFFLAANMSSQDVSSWSHGPELDFDLSLYTKLITSSEDLPGFNGNITFKLICQPDEETLRCAVRDGLASMSLGNSDKRNEDVISDIGTFHIRFDEDGVKSLAATEQLSCTKMEFLKRIVNLLNVGTDLKNKDSDFETFGDVMLGKCQKTAYSVAIVLKPHFVVTDKQRVNTTPEQTEDELEPKLKLNVIPMSISDENIQIDLTKMRDINSCNGTANYLAFLPQYGTTIIVTSSTSKMTINSPGTFESYNWHRGEVTRLEGGDVSGSYEETLRIKLNGVKGATEEMSRHDNLRIAGSILQGQC